MTLNPQVLTDARIYFASADLTGYSNKVELATSAEELDRTTFASGGAKERWGGVFDSSINIDGFWQAGDLTMPDDTLWANLDGSANDPLTVIPTSGAVGSLAYVTKVLERNFKIGTDHGKLLGWSSEMAGAWPVVRGAVLHPQGTARTATGNGTAVQLGALSASQALYVAFHVLSIAGTSTPTITVKIQSASTSGFGTPNDQGTFTAATALGGQTLKITGPITDTWWRAQWTISGTTPSFLFAVSAGIGTK